MHLPEQEMNTWRNWLRDLTSVKMFIEALDDNKDQFDPSLISEIERYIDKRRKFQKRSLTNSSS